MMELIYGIYDTWIAPNLITIGVAVAVLILAIRIGIPILIKGWKRWRNYHERRAIFRPKTWFAKQPRPLFKHLESLLANEAVREFYAPAARFITDLSEEEKEAGKKGGFSPAWLSPYPRAVRATVKANRARVRGKRLDALGQIREVAKNISITPLDAKFGGGEDRHHFRIVVNLAGHGSDEIARLEGKIMAQLGLVELRQMDGQEGGFAQAYAAHRVRPKDALMAEKHGVEFFENWPAKSPYSLPMATDNEGQPWALPLHHTLILGATGSGKSSPLNASIFQLAPFIR